MQSTHRNIPPYVAIILYKTLIRTKFTYAAPLLITIKPSTWRPLQVTQNRALRAAYRTGIRTRISNLENRSHMKPIQDHYAHTSKNTLLRIINNKNSRLLKTVFITHPRTRKAFTKPPLDHTLTHFTEAEQRKITQNIQTITQKPP